MVVGRVVEGSLEMFIIGSFSVACDYRLCYFALVP